MKSKKSAYDLVCEEYARLIRKFVPKETNKTEDDLVPLEKHVELLKEDFKRFATIPDGWEVVKEIYKEAVDNYRHIPKEQIAVTDYDAGVLGMSLHMANFIYYKLRDAGIEVDDVIG